MIRCIDFSTSAGRFYAHYLQGKSDRLLVFIPGLMEPKAGLFYIWVEMARYFHDKGHSCLLFDLAGQGDSLLPLSFDIWNEQRDVILSRFIDYKIHLVARGIGSVFFTSDHENFAICPSLSDPVSELFKQVRWMPSPFNKDFLTPAYPHALSNIEKECFYLLGAEAECIGSLQLSKDFVEQLPRRLLSKVPGNTLCYQPGNCHPLFDKQSERDVLMRKIAKDLREKRHEQSTD